MQVIDAHQHFWDPAQFEYPWMESAPRALRRRFGADDLAPLLPIAGVTATLVVQAIGSLGESHALLATAEVTPFVCGVIGWADFRSDQFADQVASLQASVGGQYLVGLRHQLEDEPSSAWLNGEAVRTNFKFLGRADLPFDLLVRRDQLGDAVSVVRRNPEVRFILDHLWKPQRGTDDWGGWASGLMELAVHENLAVKLSGTAEGDPDLLRKYVDVALLYFGANRIIFGSDWPVSTIHATYQGTVRTARDACRGLSTAEQSAVFGGNARDWYGV